LVNEKKKWWGTVTVFGKTEAGRGVWVVSKRWGDQAREENQTTKGVLTREEEGRTKDPNTDPVCPDKEQEGGLLHTAL